MLVRPSENSKELLRKCLSCILETDSKGLIQMSRILPYLTKFKLENGLGIMSHTIQNIVKVNSKLSLPLKLSKDIVRESFDVNWTKFAHNKDLCELSALTDEHLSMDIPDQAYRIGQLLLTDLLEEYDIITELRVAENELLPILTSLKESLKLDISNHYMRLMGQCTLKEMWINKHRYYGTEGVKDLSKVLYSELDIMDQDDIQIEKIASASDEKTVAGNNIYKRLGYFGIKPLDDLGGILTNLIVSIAAFEESGKTRLLAFLMDIFEAQGIKCAIFAGETPPVKILNLVKSHTFYRLRDGKMLTWQQLADTNKIEDEELRAEVNLFNASYYKIHDHKMIMSSLTAANFREKIISMYHEGARVFLIDNPLSIPVGSWKTRGFGSVQETKSKVDHIIEIMVQLKKDYPITFVVTGWTNESGGIKQSAVKGVENSRVFAGSSDFSKYADCVLQFGKSENLGSDLRAFIVKKWREEEVKQKAFILDTALACCHYEYLPEIQYLIEELKL